MSKPFRILVAVDLVALCLPTARLGPDVEFDVALILAVVTAGFWLVRWMAR